MRTAHRPYTASAATATAGQRDSMTGAISPRGAFIAPGMAVAAAAKSAPIALDKTIIHGLIDAPSTTRDRGYQSALRLFATGHSEYQMTTNNSYPAALGRRSVSEMRDWGRQLRPAIRGTVLHALQPSLA